jgi:hypothetical protein
MPNVSDFTTNLSTTASLTNPPVGTVPTSQAVNTRLSRAVWFRAVSSTVATPNVSGTTTNFNSFTRAFINFTNFSLTTASSQPSDFGTVVVNATAPQLPITIAGTYRISVEVCVVGTGTPNSKGLVEIGRYDAANTLLEIFGSGGCHVFGANETGYISATGIGVLAAGEKIGFINTIAVGGLTASHLNIQVQAIAF